MEFGVPPPCPPPAQPILVFNAEFTLYDKGINPEKLDKSAPSAHSQVRQELGTILYKQNVLGSRGPRKMKVMVPSVNERGERTVLRPTSKDETMLERYG